MQSKLDTMGKVELRAACRDAKVKNYSKMSVATMRAALTALQATAPMETVFKQRPQDTPAGKGEREVRNGVKRPVKGVCADVWAWLDGNPNATAKDVREHAEKVGWNLNNCSIELSRWRRFNGSSYSRYRK